MTGKPVPASDRFERFVSPEPNCGCHLWTGSVNHAGYGQFNSGRRMVRAHRWAWQQQNGPIPSGQYVRHRCDMPSCVNVEHLVLGTPRQNTHDAVARNRHTRGERTGTHRLTPEQVLAIRSDGRSHRVIAVAYGIGASTVSRIKARRYWRHIEEGNR